jgi:hypothetical protein
VELGTWDLGLHVNQALFSTLDLGTTIGGLNFVPLRLKIEKKKKKKNPKYHLKKENGVLRKPNIF